jgi:hypothetical protein
MHTSQGISMPQRELKLGAILSGVGITPNTWRQLTAQRHGRPRGRSACNTRRIGVDMTRQQVTTELSGDSARLEQRYRQL